MLDSQDDTVEASLSAIPQQPDVHVPAGTPPDAAAGNVVVQIENSTQATAPSPSKEGSSFTNIYRILSYSTYLDRCLMLSGALASAGAGVTLPLMTIVFGRLTASFTGYSSPGASFSQDAFLSNINQNALYLFVLFIGKFVLSYISIFAFRMTGIRISAALRMAYLKALFAQSVSTLDQLPSGMVTDQLTTAANAIQLAISDKVAILIQSTTMVIAALAISFKYSWALTLASGSLLLYVILIYIVVLPFYLKAEDAVQKSNSMASGVAGELFPSIRTVKSLCAEKTMSERYSNHVKDARNHGLRSAWIIAGLFSQAFFPTYADMALTFWFGVKLYSQGDIPSVANVVIVLMSILMVVSVMAAIVAPIENIAKAASISSSCFKIMDMPVKSKGGAKNLSSQLDADIQFNGVKFAYPSRPETEVLKGVSIIFPADKVTAIVGPSGSGKSTIVGLLERWYQLSDINNPVPLPVSEEEISKSDLEKKVEARKAKKAAKKAAKASDKKTGYSESATASHSDQITGTVVQNAGTICIGGHNIEDLDLQWWRSQIGLVQQEPFLFDNTIFENVAMGLVGSPYENATDVEKQALVHAACQESFAEEFIKRLPEGYLTRVGESGIKLSGGQRQRLAIARSIIKRPSILILDEATSSIDVRSEGIVQAALDRVSKGRTTITIAHRLSTIKKADHIIVLKDGVAIEEGTHNDLVDRSKGAYSLLVASQNLELGDAGEDFEGPLTNGVAACTDDEKMNHEATSDLLRTEAMDNADPTSKTAPKGFFRSVGLMLYEQRHHRMLYIFLVLSAATGGTVFALQSFLFSKFITVFEQTGPQLLQSANFWALMFFALSLLVLVAYAAMGFSSHRLSHHVAATYRMEYLHSMLGKQTTWFDKEGNSSGTLTSQLSSDPQQLQQILGSSMALPLVSIFNLTGCIIISFYFGWKLTIVVFFAALPVILAAAFYSLRYEVKFTELNNKVFASSSQFAAESIGAFRTVTSLTYEDLILRRYQTLLDEHVHKAFRTAPLAVLIFSLADSIELACMALAFWYGGRLLGTQEYNVEQFFIIYVAIIQGGQAAGQFLGVGPNVANATAAANRILALRGPPEVPLDASEQQQRLQWDEKSNAALGIEFNKISFRYPTRDTPVFEDLSLSISPGEYVAFVGASGCGKTTIVSLLERFYDATSGTITVGGNDITVGPLGAYRQQLGLVAQEPTLFAGTVRENLTMGLLETLAISDEVIEEACRAAEIHDFILSLPQGYGTELAAGTHASLSGGQKQRLCIARALLRRPRLLLLDEATSSLDSQSERLVQSAIDRIAAAGDVTIVVVAHRLATVQNAHRIVVLGEGGRVLEQGTHGDLVRKHGVYWSMCQAQALDR